MKRFFFRVDASIQIGSGHVMRCLTLAKALREHGIQCSFICREHEGHFGELIKKNGFELFLLSTEIGADLQIDSGLAHSSWLRCSIDMDAKQTRQVLPEKVDCLVVDHYALDARWESQMRSVCQKIVVIDDLADRTHNSDILIDQNVSRNISDYQFLVNKSCNLLIGPKFLFLRKGFQSLKKKNRVLCKETKLNILVFMGGGDASGELSLQICKILAERKEYLPFGVKHVFVLFASENVVNVRESLLQNHLFKVVSYVDDMPSFLSEIDLCFSAGGFFMYELATMNIPAIIVPQSKIQKQVASVLATKTAMVVLDNSEVCEQKIQLGLKHLLRLQERRCIDFDGLGLQRVCQHILNLEGRYHE